MSTAEVCLEKGCSGMRALWGQEKNGERIPSNNNVECSRSGSGAVGARLHGNWNQDTGWVKNIIWYK